MALKISKSHNLSFYIRFILLKGEMLCLKITTHTLFGTGTELC